jgi:hypothetical protein
MSRHVSETFILPRARIYSYKIQLVVDVVIIDQYTILSDRKV